MVCASIETEIEKFVTHAGDFLIARWANLNPNNPSTITRAYLSSGNLCKSTKVVKSVTIDLAHYCAIKPVGRIVIFAIIVATMSQKAIKGLASSSIPSIVELFTLLWSLLGNFSLRYERERDYTRGGGGALTIYDIFIHTSPSLRLLFTHIQRSFESFILCLFWRHYRGLMNRNVSGETLEWGFR